jgi:hypothetical protein
MACSISISTPGPRVEAPVAKRAAVTSDGQEAPEAPQCGRIVHAVRAQPLLGAICSRHRGVEALTAGMTAPTAGAAPGAGA